MGHKKVDRTNDLIVENMEEIVATEVSVLCWLIELKKNIIIGLLVPYEKDVDKVLV